MNFLQTDPLPNDKRGIELALAELWSERKTLESRFRWIDSKVWELQQKLKQLNQE